eukprot:1161172-Pelagomonas_calceolata.AAC.12
MKSYVADFSGMQMPCSGRRDGFASNASKSCPVGFKCYCRTTSSRLEAGLHCTQLDLAWRSLSFPWLLKSSCDRPPNWPVHTN